MYLGPIIANWQSLLWPSGPNEALAIIVAISICNSNNAGLLIVAIIKVALNIFDHGIIVIMLKTNWLLLCFANALRNE